MGFLHIMAAYSLDVKATSPTEQAVLLALAFRINPKSLKCYPAANDLTKLTHFSTNAVKKALNGLRDKGLIDWQTGGIKKRGRYGQMLANEYVLKLPVDKVKAEMEKKRKDRQADPALATTRPTPRPPDGQRLGHQKANALATRWPPTININKNKNNIEREPPIPDGNGLNYEAALKEIGIEEKKVNVHSLQNEPSQKAKMTPVGKALNACGLKPGTDEFKEYNKVFSREMLCLGENEVTDLLQVFESDVQQGKLKDCPSLPQEFLRRVKEKSATQRS